MADNDITWSIPYFAIPKAIWNLSISIWGHRGTPTGKPLSEVLSPRQVARAAQREVKEQVPGFGGEQSKTRPSWSVPTSREDYHRTMDLLDAVDVYEAAQLAKRKLENERQEAAKKEAKQRAEQERAARQRAAGRDTVRPFARGAFTTSALGSLVIGIGDELLARQRRELRERGRRRGRLRTNRRGALASPRVPVSSATNRRGALAQSPAPSASSASASDGTGVRNRTEPSGARQQPGVSSSRPLTGESAQSQAARSVMSSSQSLPSAVAQAAKTNPLLSLAQLGAVSALSTPSSKAKMSSKTTTKARSSTRTSASSARQSPLTPFNPMGVSSAPAESQSSRECNCPKPKQEQKKRREPRCVNPVISRTVKDGVRTTKTRLTCPPSKPKLP